MEMDKPKERRHHLGGWVTKNLLTVGIEAHVPKADLGHENLGLMHLPVGTKHGVDKCDAGVLAELAAAMRLAGLGLEHVGLTSPEELAQTSHKTVAAIHEVADRKSVV